jgi:prepilin-type processing-associated H-X9-DG protein
MPYIGKKPADIIATAVDTTTGTFSGALDVKGAAVFNEASADVDFRVESNGNANMLFVDGGTDAVIIGHNASRQTLFNTTATAALQIEGTSANTAAMSIARNSNDDNGPQLVLAKSNGTAGAAVTVVTDDALLGRISWQGADGTQTVEAARIEGFVDSTPGADDMPGRLTFSTTADGAATVTERMRIDAAGAVHVATTSTNQANVGISLNANGNITAARDGGIVSLFNRKSDDGAISSFRKDGTEVGTISSGPFKIFATGVNNTGWSFGDNSAIEPMKNSSTADNLVDLGTSSKRMDDIFATNGTIQTSDRNEKQDIEELTDAEKRVAVVAKGLMRKFRWKDKVTEKGDKARTHFGIIAQDLQDAFTAESLDASDYAMFCSDTWWEKEISVDAVEADEANDIEAKDAYTYMDNKDEATEGYTEKTRLGVRYSELLAFIISAI